MRGEQIRQRLHDGRRVYGTHVCSLYNPLQLKLATGLELDFVFICNEHMPIDRTETAMMCQFWAAHGVAPIVRIASPDPAEAAMALDGGAHGIVAPYVESTDEVRRLVGAVHYRPIKGEFLDHLLDGSRRPTDETAAFLQRFNRDNFLIIGIESVAAAQRVEQLAGIDGVDGVFLGPHDLTVSMEIPEQYDNPAFIDLVVDVVQRCRQCGVGAGLHTRLGELPEPLLRRFFDAGMNYLANDSDIMAMMRAMNGQLARLRAIAGDTTETSIPGADATGACIASW